MITKRRVVIAFDVLLAIMLGEDPNDPELANRTAEERVTILGIDANLQDSLTELRAYGRRLHITFPLLKDPDQSVADRVQADLAGLRLGGGF